MPRCGCTLKSQCLVGSAAAGQRVRELEEKKVSQPLPLDYKSRRRGLDLATRVTYLTLFALLQARIEHLPSLTAKVPCIATTSRDT